MTQIQSSTVWARIESSWRASRRRGGSKVAMQIATAGEPAGTGATGAAGGMRASSWSRVAPPASRARSPIAVGPEPGAIRASPQKPLA